MPKATNWDCLLLAHNMEQYNPYYSLAIVTANDFLITRKAINNQNNVLANLKCDGNMNRAFKLVNFYNVIKVRDLIKSENYEELQKILDEFKNK